MLFVSWQFVGFFLAVLAGLRVMPTRESRQALLLVASAVFYAASGPWSLLILATPALVDYACAIRIEESGDPRARRRWLALSLVTNLGLLGYFKYADFFLDSIAALLGVRAAPLGIVLPAGISFFTFKTLSYTIDVYRGELPACRSLWRYAMFIAYFPELVAGPIVRASVFLPQMTRTLEPSWARASIGLQAILLGVTKKVFVADRLAPFVDAVFAAPQAYAPATVAAAVVAYSLQIYCDFSGYSDIAIGVSRVIGFDLPENFDMPYVATSVTEFWRRWHITLSRWLRDYLYIPLGGNRRGPWRTHVNLLLTMLLGGLWHGANWTFVAWGLLHGLGLVAHKRWRRTMGARFDRVPGSAAAGWAATYGFVCLTWVFFRAPDFATATVVLRKLAGLAPGGASWLYLPLVLLLPLVVAAHLLGATAARDLRDGRASRGVRPHPAAGIYVRLPASPFATGFVLAVWLVGLFLFSPLHTSPFIYFRF